MKQLKSSMNKSIPSKEQFDKALKATLLLKVKIPFEILFSFSLTSKPLSIATDSNTPFIASDNNNIALITKLVKYQDSLSYNDCTKIIEEDDIDSNHIIIDAVEIFIELAKSKKYTNVTMSTYVYEVYRKIKLLADQHCCSIISIVSNTYKPNYLYINDIEMKKSSNSSNSFYFNLDLLIFGTNVGTFIVG